MLRGVRNARFKMPSRMRLGQESFHYVSLKTRLLF